MGEAELRVSYVERETGESKLKRKMKKKEQLEEERVVVLV